MKLQDLLNVKKGQKLYRIVNGIEGIVGGLVFAIIILVWTSDMEGGLLGNLFPMGLFFAAAVIFIIVGIFVIFKATRKGKADRIREELGRQQAAGGDAGVLNGEYGTSAAAGSQTYSGQMGGAYAGAAAGNSTGTADPAIDLATARKYYFMMDKSFHQGFYMEDENRQVVYKAPMTKNSLVKPCEFEFTNCLTGVSATHLVGHTNTTQHNDMEGESWFKFDDVEVWKVLDDRGIVIDTEGTIIKPVYTVLRGTRVIATLEACGVKVHEEDSNAFAEKMVTKGFFRIKAAPEDLDDVFLVAFAISKTGNTVYES